MPAIDNVNRVVSVTDFNQRAGEITFWGTPEENAAKAEIDTDAFNAALGFIQQQTNTEDKHVYSLHIPFGEYYLTKQFIYNSTKNGLTITSDPRAKLYWTSSSNCGFKVISGIAMNCNLQLPRMYSSAFYNESKQYEGPDKYQIDARGDYNLSLRQGIGLEINGGSWHTISAEHMAGWATACYINSSFESSDNINININTFDLCNKGFHFQAANGNRLSSVFAQVNTAFCKHPIFISGWSEVAFCNLNITTAAFVNEKNGCVVYGEGNKIVNNHITVNSAVAGLYYDTSTTQGNDYFICPFLGGNQTSLESQAINAGQSVGYFGGSNNVIRFTPINQYPALSNMEVYPGGPSIPPPGYSYVPKGPDGTIRIRDAGFGNDIRINGSIATSNAVYPYNTANIPIPLVPTDVEATFNDSIGGAPYFDKVLVSANLGRTSANAAVSGNYYMFHQYIPLNNIDNNRPIKVYPANSTALNSGVTAVAVIVPNVPRCISIKFFANKALINPTTLNFWVEL